MMLPRITLREIGLAFWEELSGRARREQVARWLAAWGRAIAERYTPVVCGVCDRTYSAEAWRAMCPRLVRHPDVVGGGFEVVTCSCGWTISKGIKR